MLLLEMLKATERGGPTHVCLSKQVSCHTWRRARSCSLEGRFFFLRCVNRSWCFRDPVVAHQLRFVIAPCRADEDIWLTQSPPPPQQQQQLQAQEVEKVGTSCCSHADSHDHDPWTGAITAVPHASHPRQACKRARDTHTLAIPLIPGSHGSQLFPCEEGSIIDRNRLAISHSVLRQHRRLTDPHTPHTPRTPHTPHTPQAGVCVSHRRLGATLCSLQQPCTPHLDQTLQAERVRARHLLHILQRVGSVQQPGGPGRSGLPRAGPSRPPAAAHHAVVVRLILLLDQTLRRYRHKRGPLVQE